MLIIDKRSIWNNREFLFCTHGYIPETIKKEIKEGNIIIDIFVHVHTQTTQEKHKNKNIINLVN